MIPGTDAPPPPPKVLSYASPLGGGGTKAAFFSSDFVTVTPTRIKTKRVTLVVRHVTTVRIGPATTPGGGIVVIVAGVLLVILATFNESKSGSPVPFIIAATGLAFLASGIYSIWASNSAQLLNIRMSSGEVHTLRCSDRKLIAEAAEAILEATEAIQ